MYEDINNCIDLTTPSFVGILSRIYAHQPITNADTRHNDMIVYNTARFNEHKVRV